MLSIDLEIKILKFFVIEVINIKYSFVSQETFACSQNRGIGEYDEITHHVNAHIDTNSLYN